MNTVDEITSAMERVIFVDESSTFATVRPCRIARLPNVPYPHGHRLSIRTTRMFIFVVFSRHIRVKPFIISIRFRVNAGEHVTFESGSIPTRGVRDHGRRCDSYGLGRFLNSEVLYLWNKNYNDYHNTTQIINGFNVQT